MNRLMLSMLGSSMVLLTACWGGGDGDGGFHYGLAPTKPLNDTGITLCGDYAYGYTGTHNNNVNCATAGATQTVGGTSAGDPVPAGQDAVYGLDVSDDYNGDGFQGFSFTRLDSNGNALAIQNGIYNDAGVEALGTKWYCVRDEVTNLVWEIKPNDNGLRDKDWRYTWYNSDSTENGGNAGTPDTGFGIGSDACFNNSRCDSEKYVADVNSATLCGANDWRLPTPAELHSLRLLGTSSPVIDSNYFPNTLSTYFWSAATRANTNTYAWVIAFDTGADDVRLKTSDYAVRLVRDR